MTVIYDNIGISYSAGRRTDPIIAAQLHNYLNGSESILNIGAGTGSYEPQHDHLVAVEPSLTMIKQRGENTASAIQASAECLPFADNSFSHCMSVLSMHHWSDRKKAFDEIKRVIREKFVAITWDPECEPFWLYRDYFPEIYKINQTIFPSTDEMKKSFSNIESITLKIPEDCIDGFDGAYWKRPRAFLDPQVRSNMSGFSKISGLEKGLTKLQNDLVSGFWTVRNKHLLDKDSFDCGYKLCVASL